MVAGAVAFILNGVLTLMFMFCVAAVHPLASVTETEYSVVEAGLTEMESVVAPFDQLYKYGEFPPVTVAPICIFCPIHIVDAGETDITTAVGSLILKLVIAAQPLMSVTVTEYIPPDKFAAEPEDEIFPVH